MKFLDSKDIAVIHDLLQLDSETCGFLFEASGDEKKNNNKLTLFVDSIGKVSSDRPFCLHSKMTEYIWHTHIITSKGYPSTEDIIKVLKQRHSDLPLLSVIFTGWGVWQLSAQHKMKLSDQEIKYLHPNISRFLHELYFKTDKGRGKFTTDVIAETIQNISSFINKSGKFGFSMSFTSWNDIDDKIVLEIN